jgi:hypothetical protein
MLLLIYNSGPAGRLTGICFWDGSSSSGDEKTVSLYIISYPIYFFLPQGRYTVRISSVSPSCLADHNYTCSGSGAKGGIETWDGSSALREKKIVSSATIVSIYIISYPVYFYSAQGGYTEGFSFANFCCSADHNHTCSGFGTRGGIEVWDGSSAPGAEKIVSSAATVAIYIISYPVYFIFAQGRYTDRSSFAYFQYFADYNYTCSGFGTRGGIEVWDGSSAPGAEKIVSSAATVAIYIISYPVYFIFAQGRYTDRSSFAYFQYFADYNYTSSGFDANGGIEIWDGSSAPGAEKIVSSAATVAIYIISYPVYFFLLRDDTRIDLVLHIFSTLRIITTRVQVLMPRAALKFGMVPVPLEL